MRSATPSVEASFTNVDPGLRYFWHPVAFSHEVVADRPKQVELLGQPWVLLRAIEGVVAYRDECPHRRAPLSQGIVMGGMLQCPYHGWRFGFDGRCTVIPSQPEGTPIPSRTQLDPPAAVAERHGLVWIAPEQPRADLCDWPEWQAGGWDSWYLDRRVTPVSAGLLMENFLDATHFRFVHAETFGVDSRSGGVEIQTRNGWALATGYDHHSAVDGQDPVPVTVRGFLAAPFSLRIRIAGVANIRIYTFFVQPCRRGKSMVYLGLSCDDTAGDGGKAQIVSEFNDRVYDEDFGLLERFGHPELPTSLSAEIHTKADLVVFRRILADIAACADEVGPTD